MEKKLKGVSKILWLAALIVMYLTRTKIINFLFKGSEIMTAIQEQTARITALGTALEGISGDVAEIRTRIDALEVGVAVKQEDLDALTAAIDSVSEKVSSVQTDTASLDGVNNDAGEGTDPAPTV